jgi:hypothetical protein
LPNPDNPAEPFAISGEDIQEVDKIWSYIEKHPAQTQTLGHQIWCEEKVEIGKYCGLAEGEVTGTADWGLVTPNEIEIADNKFGHYLVPPDSLQLKAYAIGLGSKLMDPATGQFRDGHRQIRNVKLTILQPTAAPEQRVRSVTYPLPTMVGWAKEICDIVTAAKEPNAPRIPGEDQCKFCPAAATCPERLASVTSAISDVFQPAPSADATPAPIASVDAITELADVQMTQSPADLDPEQLGRLLDQASLIEGWLKDVRAHARKLLESGGTVPGWKLIEGKRSRAWKEDETEVVTALKRLSLNVGEIYEKKLVTPAKAEAISKIAGSKKRKEKLAELWAWKTGKPTLAPESDPAPAVNDPKQWFKPETEKQPAFDWL